MYFESQYEDIEMKKWLDALKGKTILLETLATTILSHSLEQYPVVISEGSLDTYYTIKYLKMQLNMQTSISIS